MAYLLADPMGSWKVDQWVVQKVCSLAGSKAGQKAELLVVQKV
mgnify:CR=1 FL=1